MPNLLTHALFAGELLERLENEELNRKEHLFKVGAQGPDFLFFHNLSPYALAKTSPLHKMGSRLHEEHVNDFYRLALKTIREETNPEKKRDLIAYCAGHLSHWALDSSVHPYIFYRTGNCKGRSSWNHHRMESMIDAIMLKIKTGKSIEEKNFASQIAQTDFKEKAAVATIYTPILEAFWPGQIRPSLIAESLDDWNFMQKLLYDPKERKKGLARAVEGPFGLRGLFSGLLIPVTIKDNADILNLLHSQWKHPVSEITSTASFLDLYDLAKIRGEKAIRLFLQAVEEKDKEKDLLLFLNDQNYTMNGSAAALAHCFEETSFF